MYRGDYKWSRLVGAWVGRGDYAARGVPDWFLDPSKEVKPAEPASALGDEDADAEVEEKDKAGEEPRLEPIDGAQSPEAAAAAPPGPQAASI